MLHTFYAKNSGLEVRLKDGKIWLRFFTFGTEEKTQLKFMLDAEESFRTYLSILNLVKTGTKVSLIHKFNDVQSTLTIEKWSKNEKSGFGVILKKEETKINVPVDQANVLFFAELLKAMAIESTKTVADAITEQKQETNTQEDVQIEGETKIVAPDPVENTETTNNETNTGKMQNVEIEAIRTDGKAVKVAGKWYEITDKTKVEGKLEKGKKANLYYFKGEKKLFVNAIYVQ